MKLISLTAASVFAFGVHCSRCAQVGEAPVAANEVQIACHRPYEKYTSKEGEKILAYLSLLGFENVNSYQRSRGLIVDGVAGSETCKAVMKELSERKFLSSASLVKPIALIILQTNGGFRLCISNQTDRPVILLGVGSLVSRRNGRLGLSLPISATASSETHTGALVRTGTEAEVRIQVPTVIETRGIIGCPLRTTWVGEGITVLRARFVALINSNHVVIIEAEPLKLPKLLELAK